MKKGKERVRRPEKGKEGEAGGDGKEREGVRGMTMLKLNSEEEREGEGETRVGEGETWEEEGETEEGEGYRRGMKGGRCGRGT